jgi:hypothetical protein
MDAPPPPTSSKKVARSSSTTGSKTAGRKAPAKKKSGTAAAPSKPRAAEPPKVAKPKPVNPVDAVFAKYQECGWTVIRAPKGSINDLLASKDGKLHYVQVVTPTSYKEDPKYHGESKNNFIQNAFSNNATPIIATVTASSGSAAATCKIVFEDVNVLKHVIIGRKKVASTNEEEKK